MSGNSRYPHRRYYSDRNGVDDREDKRAAYRSTERQDSYDSGSGFGEADIDDLSNTRYQRGHRVNVDGERESGGRGQNWSRNLQDRNRNEGAWTRDHVAARPKREIRAPGYKKLEGLLSKEKEEILMQLSSTNFGFEKLLNEKDDIRRDFRALILRAVVCACECKTARVSLNSFLGKIQTSMFVRYHMIQHVLHLKDDREGRINHEVEINDIITLIETLVGTLPSSTHDVRASLMLLGPTISELSAEGLIADTFNKRLLDLNKFCKAVENTQGENTKATHRRRVNNANEETPPPDDFREIPIFPTLNDLTMDDKPYLRKNRLDGSYDDVDHYLDVQFRLLREDLVRPLREGIKEYLQYKNDKNRRITDIRVYNDVTIEYPVPSHDCIIYRVHFDVSRFKGIRWQSSKRLIYGSLVCLSADDFQTVRFATVANRKPEDLENGCLEIKFENENELEDRSNQRFVMVETSSFFEAYRHVLNSLQKIKEQNMPMKQYIINARHEVEAPSYLRQNRSMMYDLSPLIEKSNARHRICVKIASDTWPSAESLNLDESQFNALKTALTKEFAVIQGPPGTGKTYVGLKIVHALLHNEECWAIDALLAQVKTSPILVVCFTNHALDQFVEGIHEFLPKGIVRVGGRSSSEVLEKFNLKQLRQKSRDAKEVPKHVLDRKRDIRREMYALRDIMRLAEAEINVTRTGVIDAIYLEAWMSDRHIRSLKQGGGKHKKSMLTWLGVCGGTRYLEYDGFPDAKDSETDKVAAATEEAEEIDVAEEADLLTEQRLVDIDDNDETGQILPVDKLELIKNTVRKQLAYDPQQQKQQTEYFQDQDGYQEVVNKKRRVQYVKRQLQRLDKMSSEEVEYVDNVWHLQMDDRWRLYRFWISQKCERQRQKLFDNQGKYNTLGKELQEVQLEEDLDLMRGAKVIGMTTTGAARCRNMIQRIQPKIVVVEEAAEVLEAHIVTSLTEGCEHLILIGDHQQLRPNPTVYELAKKFKLEISLFERMLKNGMSCEKLNTQHRMRPGISSIMRNHFYKGLRDAPNVLCYENIKGLETNMFFIEHEHEETAVNDTLSKTNIYEAEFLARLCKYLIQQGYKPSEITILTTYTGQLFQFKKIMKSTFFKGIRVCAVDNYQGEENEIILLSLVRSNEAGKIGFLKEKTRMCVALSRAKKGLFCIGNMRLLAAQDDEWNKIVRELRQKGLIGGSIRLCCQNHPGTAVEVQKLDDFTKCPEGGCNKPCIARLECGHVCTLPCHPYDSEHKEVKCLKSCTKVLCPNRHPCRRKCYEECEEMCTVSVNKLLNCGHTQRVPCFKEVSTVRCISCCTNNLQCGHICKALCSQPCTSMCGEMVSKTWPCGHTGEYKCHVDDSLACRNPCSVILKCDHPCRGTCGGCHHGRLHLQCTSKCDRTLVCGHGCLEPCTRNCPPCKRPCENRCVHSKCPKQCGEKCTPCRMPCEWQCKHNRCTKLCGELCNRNRCYEPCDKILKSCGHRCAGLCGEPCPKKCLICDKEELTTILFGNEEDPDARFIELEDCGHVIESEALDTWMEQKDDEHKNIQSKVCPVCKTPIRRNLRYGNIIKQLQMDIERVKAKINGDEHQIKSDKRDLEREVLTVSNKESQICLLREVNSIKTPEQVADMKNKLKFVTKLQKIIKEGEGKIISRYATAEDNIKREIEICRTWILKPRNRFSEQLLDDMASELQRLSFYMQFYVLKSTLRKSTRSTDTIKSYIHMVKKHVTAVGPLKEQDIETLTYCLKKINEKCGALSGISDVERVQITKAMGLSTGHWFKCPKGHIYAIGDCGGATVEGKCNECGSSIGGTSHRLRDDNTLASEMDGATHAAWSEQANLENYRFDDIF